MQLAISRSSAQALRLPFLLALARQRGFAGVEIGEEDLDEARETPSAVASLRVESPAALLSERVVCTAAALDVPIVAARGVIALETIGELDRLYRRAGATVCITHGTDIEEAATLVDAIASVGASSVSTAWEIRPGHEDLGFAPAVILTTEPTLHYIRMLGGGPELSAQQGMGIGHLFSSIALSGYTGQIALAASDPERVPAWQTWLECAPKTSCEGARSRPASSDLELDVRHVEARDRLDTILGAYKALSPGCALRVTLDHDPSCMYFTLKATEPEESFAFERGADGPEVWSATVRKRAR